MYKRQLQEGQALNALVVNDVTIVDAEGNAVQPETPVTVTMTLPEAGENQTVIMFHQKADGTLETAEAGVGVLEVSSFSPIGYYVVETLNLASRASYGLEYRDLEVGGSFQIWGGEGRNHSWNISGGEGIVSLHGYRSKMCIRDSDGPAGAADGAGGHGVHAAGAVRGGQRPHHRRRVGQCPRPWLHPAAERRMNLGKL